MSFFNFRHLLHLPRGVSAPSSSWSSALFITYGLVSGGTPASLSLTPKWHLSGSVSLRIVAARQNICFTTVGDPATDLTGVLPDHRCVMTDAWPGTLSGVICHLFFDPLLGKFHRCNSPLFFGRDPPAKSIPTAMFSLLAPWGGGGLHPCSPHTIPSVVK